MEYADKVKKRHLRSGIGIILIVIFCFAACSHASDKGWNVVGNDSVRLAFQGQEVVVDLYDNSAAKDFVLLLPITLVFQDYNASEKTAQLPKEQRLDTTNAPIGYDPMAGELGYYAPFGDVVIYHKDFAYAVGIVPLGKFRSGVEKISAIAAAITVTISLNTDNPTFDDAARPEVTPTGEPPSPPIYSGNSMELAINDTYFTAILYHNATVDALLLMMHMTLDMREMAHEKYYNLPQNLPTDPVQPQTIAAGDIML